MRSLLALSLLLFPWSAFPAQGPELLVLRGSPHERGRIYGESQRQSIRELAAKWKADLAANLSVDADSFIDRFLAETDFLTAARKHTPELLEEVRGMAAGAGISQQTALAMQLLDELWFYAAEYRTANHCSAIGVERRGQQPTVIAQNMDIEKFREGHQIVLHIIPESGPQQLVFTCAGMLALNGLNERGIGVVVNTLSQLTSARSGLPVAFVIRGLLAQEDPAAAFRFVTAVPHASGQNYLIGTRDSVRDYEASAGKVVEYAPPAPKGLLFHTNHPLVNDDYASGYLRRLQKQSEGAQPVGNSFMRYASLDQRLRMRPGLPDEKAIVATLRSRDSEHAVCRRLDDPGAIYTFGSTVMLLGDDPVLRVTAGPPDAGDYVSFRFQKAKAPATQP